MVLGDWDLEHDPDCAGDDGGCKPGSPFKKAQRFDVTKDDIKVHEGWDLNKVVDNGNDIALIRLPRLATTYFEDFDEIVGPVCLGWDKTIKVPDNQYLVSGWGRTKNNAYDRCGDVQKQKLKQVPYNDCQNVPKQVGIQEEFLKILK